MLSSKGLTGSLGRKKTATVKIIGAVSPMILPIANMTPEMVIGIENGKEILERVCNFEAPKAYEPSIRSLGTFFNPSSVALTMIGRERRDRVKAPESRD